MGRGSVWAAACASAFFLLGIPLTRLCGLGHDEGLHAEPAILLAFADATRQSRSDLPWMVDSYNGALKTYLLAGVFGGAGASVAVLRKTTLACGAAAVFFLTLLALRLFGAWAGVCAGLFFATDPALLLGACYDTGPAVLSVALKSCGLWLLAGKKRGGLFAAFFFFGLAFWDKAHFAWFLGALAAAAALLYRDQLRAKAVLTAGAGLLLGSCPLLVYNVLHPAATFTASDQFVDLWAHLGNFRAAAASRWDCLLACFSGSGQWMADGNPPASLERAVLGLFALAALALAWKPSRQIFFWLSLTAGIFFLAVLSPLPVKWHHLYAAYPFPFLALLSVRAPRLPAAALTAGLVVLHLSALREFHSAAEKAGGRPQFYRGIEPLARWVLEKSQGPDHPALIVDGDLRQRLYVHTRGRLPFISVDSDFAKPSMLKWQARAAYHILSLRQGLLVTETSGRGKLAGEDPLRLFRLLDVELSPIQRFDWPDGTSWAEAFTLRNPAMERFGKAMEDVAAGRPPRLREAVALWSKNQARVTELSAALLKQGHPQEPAPGLVEILLDGLLTGRPPKEQLAFFSALKSAGADIAAGCEPQPPHVPAEGPGKALFLKDRGVCAFRAGGSAQAIRDFKAAIALDAGLLEAYLSLATVYESQGRRDLALKTLEEAPVRPSALGDLILRKKEELTRR